jgi:tetratricopeptide (TPR) repeat protein
MTARFPAEKKVLMLAGQACLERKAFTRALEYLARALALDRLDPAIPDNLVKVRLLQAREFFRKSRPDDAREAMRQTAPFEVSTPDNLTRSRWCLRIQQGLMELALGDPATGGKLLAEARGESPSEAASLYYAGIADMEVKAGKARGSPYFDDFVRARKKEAGAAQALMLARIWLHGRERLGDRLGSQPGHLLGDYLRAALKRPVLREDGRRLVEFCLAQREFTNAGMAVVEKRLGEDAGDPLFRLYRLRFRNWTSGVDREESRIELEEILAEATRRKDEETSRQARQQLDALQDLPPPPPESFGGAPPEDEFDDEGPPDFGGGGPGMAGLPGGAAFVKEMVIEQLINLMANASERDIKRMRQTRPPGMTAADFDKMVAIARAIQEQPDSGFQPGAVPPPPSSGPGTHPPRDSNQPELFDR